MKQKDVIKAGSGWIDKSPLEFQGSPFQRIGRDWLLITAGDVSRDKGNWNTMTASWAGLGVLWAKNAAFLFIRPSRHTYGFAESSSLLTMSFFVESKRDALNLCGKKSGRDTDKAAEAGLTPVVFDDGPFAGAIGFNEAREVLIGRKMYFTDVDPKNFLDSSIAHHYSGGDYHRVFVVELLGLKSRSLPA